MDRGKMPSAGRGAKSKAPQHPQDIFALGSKSTVVVSRDPEKRNIHKPSTSGVERKREPSGFGSQPPSKRARIGSPAEAVGGTSLEVDPVDLVPNVLQALDTHNSDKLLGLLTGSIRLLKSQRSKPDPILCMGLLYLTKIRPNMFAHETVTQSLCTLLKREQGAAFKNKGNPLVYILACNMLYAGHRESNNWPDIFIKVYIEDALNERCWVECSWCKCFVENVVTAFSTKQPPSHLIPTDNTLGTMSPSGAGSPLMGNTEEDPDNMELEYSVFPRYSSSYEAVETLVLEAIKEQIQRRSAAPDAIGKGFLKLLSATCGFPEIRMISASRLEAWLHSGKLWRCAQELLAYVCCNCDACGPTAARDHEVLAQLARMRLKTKPLQAAYQACLREMVSDSPPLLRSVVTHTIYNELSNVRSPNNMAVLAALIQAQPQQVPAAMADTYQELVLRPEDYLRPLRALTREVVRAARADAQALLPLARALAQPPPHEPPQEVRERAFSSLADLFCCCCLVTASHSKHLPEYRQQICVIQASALGWLLDTAMPLYRPTRHDYQLALNKVMFVEPAETYSKVDNWPPESERAATYRLCCEAPLPQNTLLRVIFIGLSKDIPVSPAEVFELVEQLVRRACALPAEENPLQVDKLEIADYIFQLCQFNPPDNITLPAGYTPPALAITSLYWRGWILLTMLAAHNPQQFAERAAAMYPTLRALIEMCITNKPSIEWSTSTTAEAERAEAERAAILQLETHLAAASNSKMPVNEHNSRLLSQLTTLEPLGPARKPPQAIIETLQAMSSQMRLGKLLCRQPALLLDLVERHGTRRAMPWLHQLLRHDQLELSVLPVQCLCEFLSAGGAGGEVGKAGELCGHLRRTVADSEAGARAVLHYYMTRLAHTHAPTRASANRGLKLVLQSSDDTSETDYNADVGPESWLELVWALPHWEAVRDDVVLRVRTACAVECVPRHLAAYIAFLQHYVACTPALDHTDLVLQL
ncbi:integrator complex subunit 1-like [Spodoptera litura]|uniref:Integrator complex subunit 1-like n=1 Tax=Spodoptera litura TaxID=69820 RepID=A0A9J7INZ3_SPOLT|nr:integrator complex subunit 1-like [Spodoptera litura]